MTNPLDDKIEAKENAFAALDRLYDENGEALRRLATEDFPNHELKYCKDCKHYRPERLLQILTLGIESPYESARCTRPKINLVSMDAGKTFCSSERISYHSIDTCGSDGKYWEARK